MKPPPDCGWRSIGLGRNTCDELTRLTMYRKAALAWCPILKLSDMTNLIIPEIDCPHNSRMLERRRISRTRIFAPAMIIPSRPPRACECIVRDITSFGALLEFQETAVLPNFFDLTFDSARTLRACHIVWRTPNEMGVRFSIPRKPKAGLQPLPPYTSAVIHTE